jgi:hypothetical protein
MGCVSPVNLLSSGYVQPILTSALTAAGLTTDKTNNSLTGTGASSSVAQQPDSSRLSPFAQLMNTLQQLQQTDPAKYKQVTGQIATDLKTAADTAQKDGNTAAADKLNQLSSDFTKASQSGDLPNIKDLAQAVGAHHGHHHRAHAAPAASDTDSTDSTSAQSQLLAAFQTSNTQSDALNPMSIIMNTLSQAGIATSNS